MRKSKTIWVVCASVLVLVGSISVEGAKARQKTDKQHELDYIRWSMQTGRAHRIGYKILKDNVELGRGKKKGTRYDLGVYITSKVEFPKSASRKILSKYFDIGDGLTIMCVLDDGPAGKVGVKAGDKLVSLNGRKILMYPITSMVKYREARSRFYTMLNKEFAKTGFIKLTVERKGEELTFNPVPELVCNAQLNILIDGRIGGYCAPPRHIAVTTGMISLLDSDAQLALVYGHELAHVTRYHIGKSQAGRMAGALVGNAIGPVAGVSLLGATAAMGGLAFAHTYELEADYIGLYHAARAGYDVNEAADFFSQLVAAKISAGGFKRKLTHPSNKERFLKLSKAAKEIHEKKAKGQVLIPDFKAFTSN